jgi:hypothetical protein
LLAGTALMFSTRFLLMAIGSALGGWAAGDFRLRSRFYSSTPPRYAISAFSVWLIPEEATREKDNYELRITNNNSDEKRDRLLSRN